MSHHFWSKACKWNINEHHLLCFIGTLKDSDEWRPNLWHLKNYCTVGCPCLNCTWYSSVPSLKWTRILDSWGSPRFVNCFLPYGLRIYPGFDFGILPGAQICAVLNKLPKSFSYLCQLIPLTGSHRMFFTKHTKYHIMNTNQILEQTRMFKSQLQNLIKGTKHMYIYISIYIDI